MLARTLPGDSVAAELRVIGTGDPTFSARFWQRPFGAAEGIAEGIAASGIRRIDVLSVDASRFTDVQRQLRNEVHALVDRIRASVRVNGALPDTKALRDTEIAALHEVWHEEYASDSEFDWSDIQPLLLESIAPVSVTTIWMEPLAPSAARSLRAPTTPGSLIDRWSATCGACGGSGV